jgi:O-antigen/teichoic acid export membrane protein
VTVSSAALGNYAAAVSISQLAFPISTAFGSVAFPRIARAKSAVEAVRVQRTAILGAVASSLAVLLPLAIVAAWLIPTVFGSGYATAVTPFWLLVPGTAAYCVNYVIEDVLRGWGRPLGAAIAEGIGAALTLLLLPILVAIGGIKGAAVASSIAYGAVTVVLWQLLRHAARKQ